jgi:hypothetical protein
VTVKWMAIVLLPWLAALACPLPALAQTEDVAVVVSENNRVSEITGAELRKVFAGERRSWAVGLPIKLIVRAPGTREHMVLLKLLGMSESEYKQYWISQVFRGEVEAEPINLPSVGMQAEALTVFAGGITLVSARDVKPGMKVLKVNGHLPGEAGYPTALK